MRHQHTIDNVIYDCCVKVGRYLAGVFDMEPASQRLRGKSAAQRVTWRDELIKHMFSERTRRHECHIVCYSHTELSLISQQNI